MATITISPVVPVVSSLTSIVGLPAIITDSLRPRMQTSRKATFRMTPCLSLIQSDVCRISV
jgi:hypothetical protein